MTDSTGTLDLFVIGGGINGTGIARDAAGRGLSVALAEKGDLACATSSASTKLFHGGLRYLEYFEIDLVRKALAEREVLLTAMPHISWPMRFVIPFHRDMRFDTDTPASKLVATVFPWLKGRRPAWMIRVGLMAYDRLGGRKILPGTKALDLGTDVAGRPLKPKFERAFEYSDAWVEDSRLVVLNARDAADRGARILTLTEVTAAMRDGDLWRIDTRDETGRTATHRARALVNAGGPWVERIVNGTLRLNSTEGIRLVRGSHIVTRKLYDHGKCYFFQGGDGRIVFAIPYEDDFTLIGTTDQDHGDDPDRAAVATGAEQDYLCRFVSDYFERPVTRDDVVWSYSGVRPLYDDGQTSATAATRDYVLSLDTAGPPVLSVYGGKITTYRKLAEGALAKLRPHLAGAGGDWTAGVPLPGGDFAVDEVEDLVLRLHNTYPFLTEYWAKRLVRAYGTEAETMLGAAETEADLGRSFGGTLTAREVLWLMDREFARTAEDVVWRRTKLGLRMSADEIAGLDDWMKQRPAERAAG